MRKLKSGIGILAILMMIVSVVAFVDAGSLPFMTGRTLGPGGAPRIYAVLLFIFSVLLLVTAPTPKEKEKTSLREKLRGRGAKGLFFYLLIWACCLMAYIFGVPIMLGVLCLLGLIVVEDWKPLKALIFSGLWSVFLYVLFVKLLNVRLITGLIFK